MASGMGSFYRDSRIGYYTYLDTNEKVGAIREGFGRQLVRSGVNESEPSMICKCYRE